MKNSLCAYHLLIGLLLVSVAGPVTASEQDFVRLELGLARDNLRISKATEERIAADLARLENSGKASPAVLKDYETYLARVQAMVSENDRIVREMEMAYLRRLPAQPQSYPPDPPRTGDMLDPTIPEEQAVDEIAALDSELNESLAAFDEMLLHELERIRLRSAPKMRELAGEAAAAAKRLRQKGVALNTSSIQKTSASGKQAENAEENKAGEAEQKTQSGESEKGKEIQGQGERSRGRGYGRGESPAETTVHGQQTKESESGDASMQKQRDRRSVGQDDDIVARQLREAAENETDPELKEKLWIEYENYKNSNRL